jgi:hypothetical protein
MYRIKSSGEIKTQGEIRKMHPNISLPRVFTEEICEALGIDPVLEGPQATPTTPYQYSMQDGVEQINSKWYTRYILGPIFQDTTEDGATTTAAEHEAAYKAQKDAEQAKSVRQQRDNELAKTDWIVIKNLELNQNIPGVWEVYRQALRDIPEQAGFPWNVTWPEQPE